MWGASVGLAPSPELPAQLRQAALRLPAGALEEPRAGVGRGCQGGVCGLGTNEHKPGSGALQGGCPEGVHGAPPLTPVGTPSPTAVHTVKGTRGPGLCSRPQPAASGMGPRTCVPIAGILL